MTGLRSPAIGWLLAATLALSGAQRGFAIEPSEMLADPALEARARTIGGELRCVVCQNQSIDDSHAPLAHDLRVLVRERLVAGDSDEQVVEYIVARYGDFVLLRPPLKPATYALWGAPILFLLAGGTIVLVYLRRRRQAPAEAPLTPDERRRLDDLMRGESDS